MSARLFRNAMFLIVLSYGVITGLAYVTYKLDTSTTVGPTDRLPCIICSGYWGEIDARGRSMSRRR